MGSGFRRNEGRGREREPDGFRPRIEYGACFRRNEGALWVIGLRP